MSEPQSQFTPPRKLPTSLEPYKAPEILEESSREQAPIQPKIPKTIEGPTPSYVDAPAQAEEAPLMPPLIGKEEPESVAPVQPAPEPHIPQAPPIRPEVAQEAPQAEPVVPQPQPVTDANVLQAPPLPTVQPEVAAQPSVETREPEPVQVEEATQSEQTEQAVLTPPPLGGEQDAKPEQNAEPEPEEEHEPLLPPLNKIKKLKFPLFSKEEEPEAQEAQEQDTREQQEEPVAPPEPEPQPELPPEEPAEPEAQPEPEPEAQPLQAMPVAVARAHQQESQETSEPPEAEDVYDEPHSEVTGWSWGAFMFDIAFVLALKQYKFAWLFLLYLIPWVNVLAIIAIRIYLGFHGRRMTYESDAFDTPAERDGFVKGLDHAGKILLYVSLVLLVITIFVGGAVVAWIQMNMNS